jgi:glycosyltransferase involved in cell wall biosynthesis
MKVSVILAARNRAKLLRRTLDSLARQSLDPDEWEIVLVDDMSTEDLRKAYAHLLGGINLTHVKVDPWRLAAAVGRGPLDNRYSVPAVALNVGIFLAQGRTLCLSRPEMIHAPTNLALSSRLLEEDPEYLFGTSYLGNPATNDYLDAHPEWPALEWRDFLGDVEAASLRTQRGTEPYWYTTYLPRGVAVSVGGVDLAYLPGVGGDDHDFRERVLRSGCRARRIPDLQGLLQHPARGTTRPRRKPTGWEEALARNHNLYWSRRRNRRFPLPANSGIDWTARECIVSLRRFSRSAGGGGSAARPSEPAGVSR